MGRITDSLVYMREELNENYNLRERINIYTGAAIGFLAPIVATRYLTIPKTESAVDETIAWAASALVNIVSSYYIKGIPLLYSTGMGAFFGVIAADNLRKKRIGKELDFEQKLQTN